MSNYGYFSFAALLLLGNLTGFVGTVFGLPGNWLMVLLTVLFTLFVKTADGGGMTWIACGSVIALAVVGEILEFAVGAAGAAKQGASRRAMILATLGAIAGSFAGSAVGSTLVPVAGTVVGAIGGGAAGAFLGALGGEYWRGSDHQKGFSVGTAAFAGRLLGTVAKLLVAAAMVSIATIDSFWN
ncbi:MAG: DUF456 domain-containing protein [Planctomycetaceae bacterium]|nr:MAG: DUF456 domain-containing protein [Planctomycetaceae bacterium]